MSHFSRPATFRGEPLFAVSIFRPGRFFAADFSASEPLFSSDFSRATFRGLYFSARPLKLRWVYGVWWWCMLSPQWWWYVVVVWSVGHFFRGWSSLFFGPAAAVGVVLSAPVYVVASLGPLFAVPFLWSVGTGVCMLSRERSGVCCMLSSRRSLFSGQVDFQ